MKHSLVVVLAVSAVAAVGRDLPRPTPPATTVAVPTVVTAAATTASPPPAAAAAGAEEGLELPPPPFSDGIFPCSACHADLAPNPVRRPLSDMHGDIELRHDEQHRWCLDCHDAADRDSLHLASGELVPFERSYLLCGQCHGEKLRDWRAGVHGRRTGQWNGQKRYLLCAHCHNPHQPRFRALAPRPAPQRPGRPGAAAFGRTAAPAGGSR